MAFFKSVILLVFCIGWVKAIQYDIDNEFNKIFHKVKQSIDDAWKWMQAQANSSFRRLNEVFTMRKPIEQGRHKYQDVIFVPPDAGAVKSDNKSTELGKAAPPQTMENTEIPATTIAIEPKIESSSTPSEDSNNETEATTIPATTEVELSTPPQEPNTSVNPPESANLQEANQTEAESNPEEVQKSTEQPDSECEESATEGPTTVLQTQSETETPLENEIITNKLESPALQDISEGNSQPIQSELQSDIEMKVVESSAEKENIGQVPESDKVEPTENRNKMKILAAIYSQQSVLIKILCFIVILIALRSIFSFVETEILHHDSGIIIAAIGNWKKTPPVNVVKSENLIKSQK